MALNNFVLIDSLMYGKINYDKIENLDQVKPICPATLSKVDCNADCSYCWSKKAQTDGIQFVKH